MGTNNVSFLKEELDSMIGRECESSQLKSYTQFLKV